MIWIVDTLGSTCMILLAVVALNFALRLSRKEPDNLMWSYLVALTMALAAFSLSRGFGHLARIILLSTGSMDTWLRIAPISGTANTTTFIIIASVSLFYKKVEEGVDIIRHYTKELERSYNILGDAHQRLKMNQERIVSLERKNLACKTVTSIAHQTRNPLQTIGGFARLIGTDDATPDEIREKADIIYSEAASLEGLIGSILKTQGQIETELQSMHAGDVLREAVRLNSDYARKSGVKLECAEEDGPLVLVDKELLAMALGEIVINAVEASEPGDVVRLSLTREGGVASFAVSDEGSGIPPESSDRIFDPTFSTKQFSAGMGMSFAKEIAELHGGDIAFDSQPGKGATFSLHLPCAD
ncbi:sensor histidine kinase [Desulfohalovibrio reitneri]|uniref:sensor histidine kinase n=1 Tax=Desulfohalovibrio reitneri TaxID=1307759 RepID=UPI000A95B441|nr:ATP-binding protein [Desulfohalovibrio reitneri]